MRGASFLPVALMLAGLLGGCAGNPEYDLGYDAGLKWTSDKPPSEEDLDVAAARTPSGNVDSGSSQTDFRKGFLDAFHKAHPPLYAPPIGGAGGA